MATEQSKKATSADDMALNPDQADAMTVFAERLQAALIKKGWSQSDLARTIWGEDTDSRGYSVAKGRDRISSYLRGKSVPEPRNLHAIADKLDMDPSELAPDLYRRTANKAGSEAMFDVIAGEPDKAHVRINMIAPLSVAVEMMQLYERAKKNLAAGDPPISLMAAQ